MSLLLCITTEAALSEQIDNGTVKIVVKDNIVILKFKDQNGEYREVNLDKDNYRGCHHFDSYDHDRPCLTDYKIEDELIIEGDKIVIDGHTFTAAEINRVQVSSEFDEGWSVKTSLPFYDMQDFTRNKNITYDRSSGEDKFVFGDVIIEAGETIYGDVVALSGNVKVYGEVMGDIVAVFGDIEMYDGSSAGGDLVTPFGKVIEIGSVRVDGDMMPRSKFKIMGHSADVDLDFSARFNRVEGLTLLSGISYSDYSRELPDFHFDLGYAFALKRWDIDTGFRQQFGDTWKFYMGLDAYQGAVTPDEWMFTTEENTIAGLFFKEDYHDFYYRKGIRGYIGQGIGRYGYLEAEYAAQENETLTKNTNKAIFGGKKNFRENYSTVYDDPRYLESIAGNRRTLAFTIGWDSRDNEDWPRRGQLLELKWESAGDDGIIGGLGGDRSYDRVQASLTHYMQLNRKQHVTIRMMSGYSDDNLPLDKWFFLGGPGSLRGYDYKEFGGDRYFLANLDYYFDFSRDFAIAVFGDIGKTGFSEWSFNNNDYKNDIGIGIIFIDAFRVDIAQRLDNSDADPVMMARAMVHF
jgi:hypothetical protein